jgi:hypothetical protein
VCFPGAGITFSAALLSRELSGVGIALIGLGAIFILIGAAQKRKK